SSGGVVGELSPQAPTNTARAHETARNLGEGITATLLFFEGLGPRVCPRTTRHRGLPEISGLPARPANPARVSALDGRSRRRGRPRWVPTSSCSRPSCTIREARLQSYELMAEAFGSRFPRAPPYYPSPHGSITRSASSSGSRSEARSNGADHVREDERCRCQIGRASSRERRKGARGEGT